MALTKQEQSQVISQLKKDIAAGDMMVATNDGYRYYTDTLTQSINIPVTTPSEVAEAYYKLVLNPKKQGNKPVDLFSTLPRVSMYIGQPDTGKTFQAQQIAETCKVDYIIKMCRDNLNLETLLEDFVLVDGKPVFQESLALQMLSGTKRAIIIFDEFNTLLTGVMKTLQPIFDDTSKSFEYRGKIYQKNMDCKFIVTLNDKDKGISIVPDAILSRSHLKFFEPVNVNKLAQWTNTDISYVTELYNIYKLLGMLNIFGTRQIKMLKDLNDIDEIRNHLYGLCRMRNVDGKILDTIQVKTMLNKLC